MHLIRPRSLLLFGHTVLMDGLCEGWPGRRVFVLGAAGEQLVVTFGADINPCLEMVFIDLSAEETTERHFPALQAMFGKSYLTI